MWFAIPDINQKILQFFRLWLALSLRHVHWCCSCFPSSLTGEVLQQEERLPEIQREDAEGGVYPCWRPPTALLNTGQLTVTCCRLNSCEPLSEQGCGGGCTEWILTYMWTECLDSSGRNHLFIFTQLMIANLAGLSVKDNKVIRETI